jgi:hypothetical protein
VQEPKNGRPHRLHSLCPYFAMFPPEFARLAIERHTKPGDLVLDPFSGRGTTLLEAILLGRRAIASDINPVAYCISAAKAHPPHLGRIISFIDELEKEYTHHWLTHHRIQGKLPRFFSVAFHPATLAQLLFLRERLSWQTNILDRFVTALTLAQLHGEMDHSPNFFSNQMPHTISTKPRYSVEYWRRNRLRPPQRNVFDILRSRARFRLADSGPGGFARVALTDARTAGKRFRREAREVSAIVTSPPYLDVTSFEEDQWLRMWFLGGPPKPSWGRFSTDDRHRSDTYYWQFLAEAWQGVAPLLRKSATVICRIGSRRFSLSELETRLRESLRTAFSRVRVVDGPRASALKKSRAVLMDATSKGCRFEMDVAYRVSSRQH